MAQTRLSNDEFLSQLSSLLTSVHNSAHGSVYLTQKTLLPPSTADSAPSTVPATPPAQILIRATNGLSKDHRPSSSNAKLSASKSKPKRTDKSKTEPKIRFATVIDADELEGFYSKYAELCKRGMEGLRKRDKRKAKERAKAKKKGKAT